MLFYTPIWYAETVFCIPFPDRGFVGRLADILGRKGAMLLALSLFGAFIPSYQLAHRLIRLAQGREHYYVARPLP